MTPTCSSAPPPARPSGPWASRREEAAALRAALDVESAIAEALAQRSRGLVDLVEALARRALREAADVEAATARFDVLSAQLRASLAAGEAAEPGDLGVLVARTLAPFEGQAAPRIHVEGPAARLEPDAARALGLMLFDLAGRSTRHGALSGPDGRATLRWTPTPEGGLHVVWREHGAPASGERLRRATGAGLLPLIVERFGAPLVVRTSPFGLTAELSVPLRALRASCPGPARAATDLPLAADLVALLHASDLRELRVGRDLPVANAALARAGVGAVLVEAAVAGAALVRIVSVPVGQAAPKPGDVILHLPATAEALAEAVIRSLQ